MNSLAPDAAAVELLRQFEQQFEVKDVPPVPVERIAESLLDLLIEEATDLRSVPNAPPDQGLLSGFLDPKTRTIWLDAGEATRSPGRRRFTIAHECGHWVLHAQRENDGIWCRPSEIVEPVSATDPVQLRKREAEANAFAAELLMPETLLTEQSRLTGRNLPALSERFDVSLKAMRFRLTTLGLLPAWMARSPKNLK
jgi:predicted transcriptional regulator